MPVGTEEAAVLSEVAPMHLLIVDDEQPTWPNTAARNDCRAALALA